MAKIDTGDTAWLLVARALVLLMTPALALFYGGMVRRKNVLSTHHALARGDPDPQRHLGALRLLARVRRRRIGGLIGGLEYAGSSGLAGAGRTAPCRALAFVAFQMMFAVITPALISGAFAERMKFSRVRRLHPRSGRRSSTTRSRTGCGPTAGGSSSSARSTSRAAPSFTSPRACRRSSARSSSASALKYPQERAAPAQPHDDADRRGPPLVRLVRLQRGQRAHERAARGARVRDDAPRGRRRRARLARRRVEAPREAHGARRRLGARRGARRDHAGGGYVAPWAAIVIGVVAGRASATARCSLKYKLRLRRLARRVRRARRRRPRGRAAHRRLRAEGRSTTRGADGALFGNAKQLGIQGLACAVTGALRGRASRSASSSCIDATIGLRVPENDEREGLDATQHGEEAYGESSGGMSHERVEEPRVAEPVRAREATAE